MPINFTIRMQDVWRRVGRRSQTATYTLRDPEWRLVNVRDDPVGLYFLWPESARFLEVVAPWLERDQETSFVSGVDAVEKLLRSLGEPPDLPTTGYQVIGAVLPRSATIKLVFTVDTDSDQFVQASQAGPKGAKELSVAIESNALDAHAEEKPGQVRVLLSPCDVPAEYPGFLAVDLGNTASAAACLPAGLTRGRDVLLVNAETEPGRLGPEPFTVDSGLRIDRIDRKKIKEWGEVARDLPSCYRWAIGSKAWTGKSGAGVVLGSKRLLAGRDWEQVQDVLLWTRMDAAPEEPREAVPLENRLPAELVLCRLLERFREGTFRQPPVLAATYPTTYSRRERNQLRAVLARALARAHAYRQTPEKLAQTEEQIHLMLDEASAAAFWFLTRRFFESPGALERFRYLYPAGMNLLLYDCGGGTTDICLLQARVEPSTVNRMKVEVRGRSGLRDFGGDSLTCAVFALLKTLLAQKMAEAVGQTLRVRLADEPEEKLAGTLETLAGEVDRLIPTRFNPQVMSNQDRRNRDRALALWELAVNVKHTLAAAKPEEQLAVFGTGSTFAQRLSDLLADLEARQKQTLLSGLKQIRVQRRQVDALVRSQVVRSIDYCNRLIAEKLKAPTPDSAPEPVHRVVLMGNAVRYPLIREEMARRLNVLFLGDCLEYDEANLKTAVVKGAVLALATELASPETRIEFDWRLCDRLPYSVAYRPRSKGEPRVLFQEYELYEELRDQTIDVLPPEGEHLARYVVLERRWPGEEEFTPYLKFTFAQGVQGPVTIRYDPEKEFLADDGYSLGEPSDIGSSEIYRAPVQRGTL